MLARNFNSYWDINYPETVPISYLLKNVYNDRWFRIHNLPDSKRYADTPDEMKIILQRQNEIITDLMGETEFFLLTGFYEYNSDDKEELSNTIKDSFLSKIHFEELRTISIFHITSNPDDKNIFFKQFISQQTWAPGLYDSLLKEIANDETRAFMVNIEHQCIIAPYDGGMDIILGSELLRDIYQKKYNLWGSQREDGL